MNITLIISTLSSGGAERVLVGLANWWASHGANVTIITYSGGDDFYVPVPSVRRLRLDLRRNSSNLFDTVRFFIWRIITLRRVIKSTKPGCVVSFLDQTNILTLLACLGTSLRVVVSERIDPRFYPIRPSWGLLRDMLYRRADTVVVQTESLRPWAEQRALPTRVAVIPNALDEERIKLMDSVDISSHRSDGYRIVAMGRMDDHQKGFDLLIQACAKILPAHINWSLELIGDGQLRSQLEQLADQNGIRQQVHFHGRLKNPFAVMKGADIFVLSSRVEGFPNVLLEAMGLGVAVVSFDCPSGPSELIIPHVSGLLVPTEDVDALAAAIQSLMVDPARRAAMGAEAFRVRERYAESKIMGEWSRVTGVKNSMFTESAT